MVPDVSYQNMCTCKFQLHCFRLPVSTICTSPLTQHAPTRAPPSAQSQCRLSTCARASRPAPPPLTPSSIHQPRTHNLPHPANSPLHSPASIPPLDTTLGSSMLLASFLHMCARISSMFFAPSSHPTLRMQVHAGPRPWVVRACEGPQSGKARGLTPTGPCQWGRRQARARAGAGPSSMTRDVPGHAWRNAQASLK